jgi:hypothetical protein
MSVFAHSGCDRKKIAKRLFFFELLPFNCTPLFTENVCFLSSRPAPCCPLQQTGPSWAPKEHDDDARSVSQKLNIVGPTRFVICQWKRNTLLFEYYPRGYTRVRKVISGCKYDGSREQSDCFKGTGLGGRPTLAVGTAPSSATVPSYWPASEQRATRRGRPV